MGAVSDEAPHHWGASMKRFLMSVLRIGPRKLLWIIAVLSTGLVALLAAGPSMAVLASGAVLIVAILDYARFKARLRAARNAKSSPKRSLPLHTTSTSEEAAEAPSHAHTKPVSSKNEPVPGEQSKPVPTAPHLKRIEQSMRTEGHQRILDAMYVARVSRNHVNPDAHQLEVERARLTGSPLLDVRDYVRRYPEAAADPVGHYLTHWDEADPHPLFDTKAYVLRYRFRSTADCITPLRHFLDTGAAAGLSPHPLFSPQHYAAQSGCTLEEAFERYIYGSDGPDVDPHPLLSVSHYSTHLPFPAPSTMTALEHYVTEGARRGVSPHPSIDPVTLSTWLGETLERDPLSQLLLEREVLDLPQLPTTMPPGVNASERHLRWSFLVSGVWERSGVVLVRVVGNDLPPRHAVGQSVANVRWILEHEVLPVGVVRRWVVNRISDPLVEADVVGLLEGAGEVFVRVPFVLEEYAEVGLWFGDFDFAGLSWEADVGLDENRVARA